VKPTYTKDDYTSGAQNEADIIEVSDDLLSGLPVGPFVTEGGWVIAGICQSQEDSA
jgi:hypothetical protein